MTRKTRSASAPGWGWAPALPLALATFLFWLSLYLYVPFLPGYIRQTGGGATWIGIITGAYGLAQLLLRIPTGLLSDRVGRRKPFVLAGTAFTLLSGLAFAAAQGPLALLTARVLAGLAATTWVAFTVLFTAYFPGARGPAMAVVVFLNQAGVITGQTVGPFLAGRLGAVPVFWISAVAGALALASAALVSDRQLPAGGTPALGDLLRVGGNPLLLAVSFLGIAIQYLIHGGTFVFVYDWAQQELGARAGDLGTLALLSGVPGALTTLVGGTWLIGRWGYRRAITAGFIISGLAMAAVPLAPGLNTLYWTQAIGGLARGLTTPLLMSLWASSRPPTPWA